MALMINDDCTNCDACVESCPNEAISEGDTTYVIDPAKCTECVGAEDEPQCALVCPVDACVPDPNRQESKEVLQARYEKLHA
ncbi:MAG: YfhL family 4Fe-4S dicluster ferredoxin [Rhodospirillales bacterium]|jgi:ferredoxin|nr:YfhL family 4Fe-4S dicluster ferredoxin [Rhodospirillales bacterium]